MRAPLEEIRRELAGLRERVDGLGTEVGALREEMRAAAAESRWHFDVVAEGLRGHIRTVAEGVALNTEAVGGLRSEVSEVYGEMDRRFDLVGLAFVEVRRDIAELRASR